MWINLAIIADNGIFANASKRTYITILANRCRRSYIGLLCNTCLLRFACLVYLQKLGYAFIGILYTYKCGSNRSLQLHILIYNDNGRFRVVDVMGVFGI